jgi:hypothetical protein
MRAHILAGITMTVLLGAQAAYPQAAAESVLLNSNSATATVKAGSSIGNALNKASNRLSNQVQQTVAEPSAMTVKIERTPRFPAKPASAAATATKPAPATGSLITSIQGGQLKRPSFTATPTSK